MTQPHMIVLQSMANFIFSALSTLHLKAEVQEVEETVEDQDKAIANLVTGSATLTKKVNSNCERVSAGNKRKI